MGRQGRLVEKSNFSASCLMLYVLGFCSGF
jgi:hypothetical protein